MVLSGNKQSNWYKVNGIALAVVFFFARVLVYGLGLWHMWQSRWVLSRPASRSLSLSLNISCSNGMRIDQHQIGVL